VRDLVALGSVINARGDHGMTALHYAAIAGHTAVAEALLTLGADRSLPDDFGQSPAKVAALGSHTKLAALLRPSRKQRRGH
jgi:ankyrin repeat protein